MTPHIMGQRAPCKRVSIILHAPEGPFLQLL